LSVELAASDLRKVLEMVESFNDFAVEAVEELKRFSLFFVLQGFENTSNSRSDDKLESQMGDNRVSLDVSFTLKCQVK
jgi:hypothetical protein